MADRSGRYDTVILGGGSGGYACALRAAGLGKKVALIEKDRVGGTCLHRGCIPTKALVAVGRAPVVECLGYEAAGVTVDRGFVQVDGYCRSSVPTVSAVGDLTPGLQLAHAGFAEGRLIYSWEMLPSEMARPIHPHPSQSEAIGETHLALAGKPLHVHA